MMKSNIPSELSSIIDQFSQKNILVVGDIMLDNYIFGDINRISHEAPVPILTQTNNKPTLGGAANVAENICKLAKKVYLAGVIGNDENGTTIKNLLVRENIDRSAVVFDSERQTSTKTRLIAQNQQIARLDHEKTKPITEIIENKILEQLKDIIPNIDAIIMSDYAKGVLTPKICETIIHMANENKTPVIVDPKNDFKKFKNATVIKPNQKEITTITGIEDTEHAVKKVFEITNAKHLLVTRDKEGMAVFTRNPQNNALERKDIESIADEVYDITGAGDTVTSIIALSLTITDDIFTCAKIATHGAGIVVHKLGTAYTSKDELLSSVEKKNNKIKTREEMTKLVQELKAKGKTIVSTNGSFDILHAGHVYFMRQAKKQGDILIVGLNSDQSVKAWKKHIGYKDWDKRPVVPQDARAEMLAAFDCIDYVTIYDEPDSIAFVESVKPHIHVNGSEYGKDSIEAEAVKKHGGKMYIVEKIPGMSTSQLIEKIKDAYKD